MMLFSGIFDSLAQRVSVHYTRLFFVSVAWRRGAAWRSGLCSCRVRGVDGSCAKHLTVESHMVIYAPNSYTY